MALRKIALLVMLIASSVANADPDCSEQSIEDAKSSSYDFWLVSFCETQEKKNSSRKYIYQAYKNEKKYTAKFEEEESVLVCNPSRSFIKLIQLKQVLEKKANLECSLSHREWQPGDKAVGPLLADCLSYAPISAYEELLGLAKLIGDSCNLDSGEEFTPDEMVVGPSYDCSGDINKLEMFICNDAELSFLDLYMTAVYRIAISKDYAALSNSDIEAIRREQREWLSKRGGFFESCPECGAGMAELYENRTRDLEEIIITIPLDY